jgi:molybdopterin/thiamine biosynthesis adenylyltransferase
VSSATYVDQFLIFNPDEFATPIHVIGAGSIGSNVVLHLAKIGVPEIHIWDADTVELKNLPSQIYRKSDLGQPKVEALAEIVSLFGVDADLHPHRDRVTADTELSGLVISGVDSMASRSAIWQAVQANTWQIPLYMDGRIGGEQGQLYTFSPSDFEAVERYGQFLFPDSEAVELPCGGRSAAQTPAVLAGLITEQVSLWARELPHQFAIVFNLKTMSFMAN